MHEKYRFILFPRHVISQHDGQRHWISADQLRRLYNIPRNADYIIVDRSRESLGLTGYRQFDFKAGDVPVHPREDGDYKDISAILAATDEAVDLTDPKLAIKVQK